MEPGNLYKRMMKSKKLEILKIKSEFQQFCHKSRMALIEIADDSDIDDDERERFSFTLSAKNADAFINGQYSNKKKEKHHLKSNDSYVNN
ncbi:unnamed protein product [Rotaria sp. Silwood1]|nr:unnamed protein product [Rotaria sp. Silwood1]